MGEEQSENISNEKKIIKRLLLIGVASMLISLTGADHDMSKRAAYSYVSEYKRLPVYNFGLGKRGAEVKRSPDPAMYSFGLGKRDYDSSSQEDYDDQAFKEEYGKRVKQYAFGLGKRLGAYSFGLGKRLPAAAYSFGLGKRPEGKLYSFGLGKRDEYEPKRANGHKFSFGLGKREAEPEESNL